ncbi:RdgB/HAM1 family non-canonical purine NTP pyrophosphatase [Nakamurella flavida]|uniref:dITP/XTP pyrophosphatase n=1 Tax=Nakamurella flavida TaxID=363630 RepID=A0A938YGF0_9ACTN|nr:RdgB/HAM1 family non-canonical purine NTP pyrophosphatase [Nakamurella flavida]MBM9477215.1 RdgB/HAM1 family non-canonical purine NTP pyrophosphatase [Nakamurella flavida]MDP9780164.1 XTP/dITP diphosphohydrolase [Nakamurella flavida]
MSRVLLATRNAKKLVELRRIVGAEVTVLGLDDLPPFPEEPETGATFEENALAKAVQAARETGEIAVADDSGLAVDALNGMPGVLSARWAGRHGDDAANNALLLAQLGDVPDERRGAMFVSAVAMAVPGAEPVVVRGEWRGRILRAGSGANGFGYDPLFVPAESDEAGDGRTSAELAPAEKDALSHRGRALAVLAPQLLAAVRAR